MSDDLGDFWKGSESIHDGGRFVGGDQDVDVFDGIASSAKTPTDADLLDGWGTSKRVDEAFGPFEGNWEQDTLAGPVKEIDRFEDFVSGLGSEPFEFREFAAIN
jgi:hypothetical protein